MSNAADFAHGMADHDEELSLLSSYDGMTETGASSRARIKRHITVPLQRFPQLRQSHNGDESEASFSHAQYFRMFLTDERFVGVSSSLSFSKICYGS